MGKRVPVVDVSIDFDFFCREDPMWDWGHGEGGEVPFESVVWAYRYGGATFNIIEQTDPETYADFLPSALVPNLVHQKRLVFTARRKRERQIGFAESHQCAFDFLRQNAFGRAPDFLVNIDAHHDVFGDSAKVHCGNWMTHLHADWPTTQFIQVYPKWQEVQYQGVEPASDNKLHVPAHPWLNVFRWADWPGLEGVQVRNVFLCRSGAWVPPHLDPLFIGLAQELSELGYVEMCDKILIRDHLAPTPEEHAAQVAETRQRWETLDRLYRESKVS